MQEVMIVFNKGEVCFVSDSEEDIVTYLESVCFDRANWENEMGMSLQEWLNNGHFVGDLTDFLEDGYYISTFGLGIDYRSGSPRFMRWFK